MRALEREGKSYPSAFEREVMNDCWPLVIAVVPQWRVGRSELTSSSKGMADASPSSVTATAIILSKNYLKTWIASQSSNGWAGFSRASAARNSYAIPTGDEASVRKTPVIGDLPASSKTDASKMMQPLPTSSTAWSAGPKSCGTAGRVPTQRAPRSGGIPCGRPSCIDLKKSCAGIASKY